MNIPPTLPPFQPTTLVFDWGNTLMQTFPQYDGPMAGWPEVAALPGAQTALAELSRQYRLVLASNAQDSSAGQIRAALDRVELGQWISEIYTFNELNSRKPELRFFRALQQQLHEPAEQLIMIGDDYAVDMLGAQQAGWKSIWYNPLAAACPGCLPLHSAEITHLQQLPAALQTLNLPDWNTCQAWLIAQGASPRLWQHVQGVALSAYLLAVWLRAAGEPIDPLLAHRGGLLHDLAKLKVPSGCRDHGEGGAFLLRAREQYDLAEIANRHMLFGLLDENRHPVTWEQTLVYFADKLVEGAYIAGLDARMQSLRQRYQIADHKLDNLLPALYALQERICQRLEVSPEVLLTALQQTASSGKAPRRPTAAD